MTGDCAHGAARQMFDAIGGHVTTFPWCRLKADPVEAFTRRRALAYA